MSLGNIPLASAPEVNMEIEHFTCGKGGLQDFLAGCFQRMRWIWWGCVALSLGAGGILCSLRALCFFKKKASFTGWSQPIDWVCLQMFIVNRV